MTVNYKCDGVVWHKVWENVHRGCWLEVHHMPPPVYDYITQELYNKVLEDVHVAVKCAIDQEVSSVKYI